MTDYAALAERLERKAGLGVQPWSDAEAATAIRELLKERDRLDALINNPHTNDFLEAVRTEAAHQRERWGDAHDFGKSDPDWFWLIGYLAGKAVSKPEKALHHIVTTAAVCLNWHAAKIGASNSMRPGLPMEIDHEA